MTTEFLGFPFYSGTPEELLAMLRADVERGESRVVLFVNAHMLVEASGNEELARLMRHPRSILCADGMPIVFALRRLASPHFQRLYGPETTQRILGDATFLGHRIALVGGNPAAQRRIREAYFSKHGANFKALNMPFAPVEQLVAGKQLQPLKDFSPRLVFVGLGCPKQELWASRVSAQLGAVYLCVGAAFDFVSGIKPWAPLWVRRIGMEWFFRLLSEPRRLWKRYLQGNPRFLWLVFRHYVLGKKS